MEKSLQAEISDYAEGIMEEHSVSLFEALQIAVKMQQNRIIADAFLVNRSTLLGETPVALEAIAMSLSMK